MPQPERSPRPPDYKAYLAAYERAWHQAQEHPSAHNVRLLLAGRNILYRELQNPGKFDLGTTVATPGATEAMQEAGHIPPEFLLRHKNADWGDLDEEDKREIDQALHRGSRVFSSYTTRTGERLWVVTESDRSVTTLLLPQEH